MIKKRIITILIATHGMVALLGFFGGIYALPILTAPPAPTVEMVTEKSIGALFTTQFKRELKDSDALHWGEGDVAIGSQFITLNGAISPGPNYTLYLSPQFVETEADFKRLQSTMVAVGDVKTFDNFVVEVSPDINPSKFNSVIVWCDSFEQFITAAKYQ